MKIKLFAAIAVLSVILISCKKQELRPTTLANLTVINVVNGGSYLLLGTCATPIYNYYYQSYGLLTGNHQIKLVDTTGVDKVYYEDATEFVVDASYSLFLTGTLRNVESVFLKEVNVPSHSADVFGVRVVNLVTGGVPISINLAGTTNGSFVISLPYKAISSFKDVSSSTSDGDKVFEVRNAATGALISSFTIASYDMPRFRNITLVVAGTAGSETVLRVNNY